MILRRRLFSTLLGGLLAGLLPGNAALAAPAMQAANGAPAATDTLFAAASLSVVLDELTPAYRAETGRELRTSYAASSLLARQIEGGAAADAFISADTDWMDYLEHKGLLAPGTRRTLLGNRLVLVAPAGSTTTLQIARVMAIAPALGDGRLAVADPDSVPAGRYAKAALESLGAWQQVADHLVRADNVRAALTFVERGEAPLGIVYGTDAQDDAKVRVVGEFPAGSHPPILYPLALLRDHHPGSEALLPFLRGATARAAFARHGFQLID